MKVTIIGWYGTETIGDRAILAGLISLISRATDNLEIELGSLYPFFSERMVKEDLNLIHEMCGKKVPITLFDSKNSHELSKSIERTDITVMGGGPLMDLEEVYMVEYAFKIAKKKKKKTALLGCGIGPLFHNCYKKSVINTAKNADLILLRDSKSIENLKEIACEYNVKLDFDQISSSLDPAVEVGLYISSKRKAQINNTICINIRDFPAKYSKEIKQEEINQSLANFVKKLAKENPENEILLVPMHYFHIGDDDRIFMSNILLDTDIANLQIQQKPLSLRETFEIFQDAYYNIGMRFHSVVFQTIVSGRNYVLDYTEPKKGKISGFLKDVDHCNFYTSRYIALQNQVPKLDLIKDTNSSFEVDRLSVNNKLKIYIEKFESLINENPSC